MIRFLRVENRPELGAQMSMEHLDQFFPDQAGREAVVSGNLIFHKKHPPGCALRMFGLLAYFTTTLVICGFAPSYQ